MQITLIISLIIILYLLICSCNKEHYQNIFPNYIADAYYWPTNCMETLFDGVKCFPFWPSYYYPYFY